MQHEDQLDDTGASKHHTETSLVWLKLIQTNRSQMKFTQPLLASTWMAVTCCDGIWKKPVSGT